MRKNPSISDLEHLNCLKLAEPHQLWVQLVENWGVARDLADWFVGKLVVAESARAKAEKQVADLEADE
jgi:hypothetical protein